MLVFLCVQNFSMREELMGLLGLDNLRKSFNSDSSSALNNVVGRFVLPKKSIKVSDSESENLSNSTSGKNIFTSAISKYSEKHDAVIGVDIIPGHIRVCQITEPKGNDDWHLEKIASAHIGGDEKLSDIQENPEKYIEALQALLKEHKITIKNASVAIPVLNSIVKTLTLPEMTEEEIDQAIEMGSFWQNLVQLPGELEEYSVFYEVVKRDEQEKTMDILFVGSKNEDVNLYTDIIKKAGLNPLIVDVRCFALSNIFHINAHKRVSDKPIVFLKFGPDENYIHIIDRGESFLYDIYISDEERSTIMDHFNDAEILQRYATQTRQIISSHENAHQSEKVDEIFVVSLMPAISTFVSKLSTIIEGYNVSECNFFDHIDIPAKYKERVNNEENRSAWAVAMGLAARKFDLFDEEKGVAGADNVNLLPGNEEFKKEKRINLLTVFSLVPVAIFCLLIATSSFKNVMEDKQVVTGQLSQLSGVDSLHSQKSNRLNSAKEISGKLVSLEIIKAELPTNQREILSSYKHITKVIPEGVWLNRIEFTVPNRLLITGNAMSERNALTFVKDLKGNQVFSKAALKTIHADNNYSESPHAVKIFTVNAEIDGLRVMKDIKGGDK